MNCVDPPSLQGVWADFQRTEDRKRKLVTLQCKKLADATLPKSLRSTSPVISSAARIDPQI